MKYFFLLITLFSFALSSQAQNNCVNYVQVCGNQSISLNVSGGGIQEISNSSWCFSMENNSLWLRFTIQNGGTLGFNLIPASTSIKEDYDFMVFGPNVSCSSLGSPIRCSSTNPEAAGLSNNHTGMNSSSSDVSEGPGYLGNGWVQWLTVSSGESYFLLIDRPIGNASFTLNWTGTATLKKTDAGPDKVVCKGKTTTMSATETGTWIQHTSNPSTVTINGTTNPNATVSGFNTPGVYKFTWSSIGCADTMQITVYNTSSSSASKSICEGQSWNGHTTSGTYTDTLKNINGCDSIISMSLTVKPKSYSTINKTICQGETFLGRTVSGTYQDILMNTVGCDSVRTLNLTVLPSHAFTINKGICDGESFMGKNATGIYTFSYKNIYGCDSIITLDLKVRNYSNVIINANICEGQSYNGKTTSGTYKDSFKSIEGCDSIRTVNLTVYSKTDSTIYDTICDGRSWDGHRTAGTFVDILRNAHGCDSIRTLHLYVKPNSFFTINKTICEGDVFLGRSATGNYSDMFMSANGCDSTRYLNLYVTKKKIVNLTKKICEGDNFMGYTQTGFYRDTLRTSLFCDSIITNLNLTVIPKALNIQKSICEGESFLGYDSTGVYYDDIIDTNNCPRHRRLDLTVFPITYGKQDTTICYGDTYKGKTKTGSYKIKYINQYGCDSIFSLNLTVKPDFLRRILRDTNTCLGNPVLLKTDSFYKAYSWNDGLTSWSRPVSISNLYIVTVTNIDDCLSTDSAKVHFYPIPEVNIGDDLTIYNGEIVHISPIISGAIYSKGYRWYPKDSFLCDTCDEQTFEPSYDRWVKLIYSDHYTCTNSDSIFIRVLPVFDIGFPTAFSPNGDGRNDFFELNGGPVKHIQLSIYNRWGEKVYEYNGQQPIWDGNYNGSPAPTGVYMYFYRISTYSRQIKEKFGSVTIVR